MLLPIWIGKLSMFFSPGSVNLSRHASGRRRFIEIRASTSVCPIWSSSFCPSTRTSAPETPPSTNG